MVRSLLFSLFGMVVSLQLQPAPNLASSDQRVLGVPEGASLALIKQKIKMLALRYRVAEKASRRSRKAAQKKATQERAAEEGRWWKTAGETRRWDCSTFEDRPRKRGGRQRKRRGGPPQEGSRDLAEYNWRALNNEPEGAETIPSRGQRSYAEVLLQPAAERAQSVQYLSAEPSGMPGQEPNDADSGSASPSWQGTPQEDGYPVDGYPVDYPVDGYPVDWYADPVDWHADADKKVYYPMDGHKYSRSELEHNHGKVKGDRIFYSAFVQKEIEGKYLTFAELVEHERQKKPEEIVCPDFSGVSNPALTPFFPEEKKEWVTWDPEVRAMALWANAKDEEDLHREGPGEGSGTAEELSPDRQRSPSPRRHGSPSPRGPPQGVPFFRLPEDEEDNHSVGSAHSYDFDYGHDYPAYRDPRYSPLPQDRYPSPLSASRQKDKSQKDKSLRKLRKDKSLRKLRKLRKRKSGQEPNDADSGSSSPSWHGSPSEEELTVNNCQFQ